MPKAEVANTLERLLRVYIERREEDERFLDTVRRIGLEPFRVRAYLPGSDQAKQEQERYAVGY